VLPLATVLAETESVRAGVGAGVDVAVGPGDANGVAVGVDEGSGVGDADGVGVGVALGVV